MGYQGFIIIKWDQLQNLTHGAANTLVNVTQNGMTGIVSQLGLESWGIPMIGPLSKNKTEIQRLVLDKAGWILRKQREYKQKTTEIIKPSFKKNTTLPYLGTNYPLQIVTEQAKDGIDLTDRRFVIETRSTKTTSSHLNKLYEIWLREKAQSFFNEKVNRYSRKLGVQVKRIVVKNLRNRWGSLTKNGTISLNLNLVKAPEDVIDYIILHELCHLKIKEHSHLYWDLVHKFVPNYQDKIEWLNTNGRSLINW